MKDYVGDLIHNLYFDVYGHLKLTMYYGRYMKASTVITWGRTLGLQDATTMLFLANFTTRCSQPSEELRPVPKELQHTASMCSATCAYHCSLVFHLVGNEYPWTFPHCYCIEILVAVYFFTKWIEVKALGRIIETKAHDFIWKSIICHFGLPRVIVTNNGH